MKDIKDVVAWLEEEIAQYEMKNEELKVLTNKDEAKYFMAQELLAWVLGYKFDSRYAVSRVPCNLDTVK